MAATFKGRGAVWNPDGGGVFARFNADGLFTTDDADVIAKMKALGYPALTEDKPAVNTTPKQRGRKAKS